MMKTISWIVPTIVAQDPGFLARSPSPMSLTVSKCRLPLKMDDGACIDMHHGVALQMNLIFGRDVASLLRCGMQPSRLLMIAASFADDLVSARLGLRRRRCEADPTRGRSGNYGSIVLASATIAKSSGHRRT